jgi:hypothetical protein
MGEQELKKLFISSNNSGDIQNNRLFLQNILIDLKMHNRRASTREPRD